MANFVRSSRPTIDTCSLRIILKYCDSTPNSRGNDAGKSDECPSLEDTQMTFINVIASWRTLSIDSLTHARVLNVKLLLCN